MLITNRKLSNGGHYMDDTKAITDPVLSTLNDNERAALLRVAALGDTIRELGQVPSGHLYARAMEVMTSEQYEWAINSLVSVKLVRRDPNHMLTWIGGE
jgi:hypothetical protein